MRIEVNGTTINTHRPDPQPDTVTFHNVTVVIAGSTDAVDAYDLLCEALATMESKRLGLHVEWETDTYTTYTPAATGGVETDPASTSELFPESRRRDADTDQ